MKGRRLLIIGILVALGIGIFAAREWSLGSHGKLHVYFFDVGQGDGSLIVTPSGRQIVIDGGPNGTLLTHLGETMPFLDRSIDLLVLTHPHLDHVASFPEILRRYRVGAVLMTGMDYGIPKYAEFLTLLKEEGASILLADPTKDIDMGDGTRLDVLWPGPGLLGQGSKSVNDTSVTFRLEGRGKTVLFTGDIEAPAELALLKSGQNLHADILKVGHHGGKTSTGTGFLLAVDPDVAVISCSSDNSYGHPHPIVIERLKHFGIETHVTAWEGTVTMSW